MTFWDKKSILTREIMTLRFFNTLTKSKQEFAPLDGIVKMYSCGPTVYSYAHIGNMRAYIFMDTLRRTLKNAGFDIFGVINITDVGHLTDDGDDGDDKMAIAAKRDKKTPWEIAEFFTKAFFDDLDALNIGRPEVVAKATDHIADMLDLCKKLVDDGFAYETDDGIYFDVTKADDYGKLSGDRQGKLAGARIGINDQKKNPSDFALWKIAADNHIMKWDSPWGASFPGWHIECSAMAHKYLGPRFDIHTGGIDHVPVHHENEIAQSEAFNGCSPAAFWMHNEFMQVDGGKMSKSLGNNYTIADLNKKGYSAMEFRCFCHTAHYRKKLNFSFDSMNAAKTTYARLTESLALHKAGTNKIDDSTIAKHREDFDNAICDDLNTPLGMGILHTILKLPHSKQVFDLAMYFDTILGLQLEQAVQNYKVEQKDSDDTDNLPQEIKDLAQQRWQAKADKNFAKADELRKELTDLGYTILDSKDGFKISKTK